VALILLCAGAPVVGYVGYTQIWPRLASTAPEISLPTPEPASPDNADNAGDAPEPPPAEPTPEEAAPAEPAEPASPEPPEPPAVDDAGMPTAPITVQAADRMIRRIELAKPDGTLVLESKGSLEGAVPPGPYRLTVKLAGRDPLAADVTLDVTGLHVACAPDEKMVKVLCRNGDGAIPLVLGGK
jgi:hypothetical protein